MSSSPLPLDCAPLDRPLDATLSGAQLSAAEKLQRIILSPHDHDDLDAWRSAVCAEARTATAADAAMLQLPVPGLELLHSDELCATRLSGYSDLMPELERHASVLRNALSLGAGNRYLLWLDHLEWLYASAYFNELVTDLRAFDTVFAAVPSGGPIPVILHVYHDTWRTGPRFQAPDVRLMHLVRPALEAAFRAVGQVAANRASFLASLETRRDGALVFDRRGRLRYRNPSFPEIVPLQEDRETLFDVGRSMAEDLFTHDPELRFSSDATRRPVRVGEDYLMVSAVFLGEGVFDAGPTVLVTLHANEPMPPDGRTLRERFGLTRRQAEVARLLARRLSNVEIAERLHISPNTARHHTEAVMYKLEVHDRREVRHRIRNG